MYWFVISAGILLNSNNIRHLATAREAEAGTRMPDYIYLLENRLSADQRHALAQLREAARDAGTILFLTGDAVRDLTSGHAVRDLEIAVHGNALKLKKTIEKLGGKVWGEHEPSQSLFLCFPGTVRVDVISTHTVKYAKPGKPAYHQASIQEDLRRRDFTVNAMAISLNEGSFGLLMDPLNGAADIEARTLRLVSNYGFIEDPSLMIRATRYHARLGWDMDMKTRARYDNARADGVIEFLTPYAQSSELEQIGHEEDGLTVLRALEAEGWMKVLFPAWTSAKADEEKLRSLHELAVALQLQGVHPDMSAAQFQLLTAKLASKDLAALKKALLRPGFVQEWNSLDQLAAGFQKVLLSKDKASASAGYKLFTSYDPEAVLWLGFTSKSATVQERYNQFLRVWPEAKQGMPHALMQEMRITPELATYNEIVHCIFLQLIDGKLTTPEEMRAYLEPFSPPAPPPQVTIKRPRVKRAEKIKEQAFDEDEEAEDGDLDDIGGDEDEIDLGLNIPKGDLEDVSLDDAEPSDEDLEEDEDEPVASTKSGGKKKPAPQVPVKKTGKTAAVPAPVKAKAQPPAKAPAAKAKPAPTPDKSKHAPPPAKKSTPVPTKAHKSVKPQPLKTAKPAPKPKPKPPMKTSTKVQPKAAAKPVSKPATKAAKPAKAVAKKTAAKPARKR